MSALATMHAGSFLSGWGGLDFEFMGLHDFFPFKLYNTLITSLGCIVTFFWFSKKMPKILTRKEIKYYVYINFYFFLV